MSGELMTVEYESFSGITVKLDAQTVRNTLTRGNGKVTDNEVAMFIRTCQAKKLDPLENGEVWLIKYDDKAPAQLVVGYFAYIRRADKFPDYQGFKAGVVVAHKRSDGSYIMDDNGFPILDRREGSAVYKKLGEELFGGWCRVYRERKNGGVDETYTEVSFDEYSTGKSNWNAKPATMIRKVAVSQAFRAAFPNEYEGLYTEEEMIASGAVPTYSQDGEFNTVDEDPIITQEQRKEMFAKARSLFDKDEANVILKELLSKHGFENTTDLPTSVFNEIMNSLNAVSMNAQDAEYVEVEEG